MGVIVDQNSDASANDTWALVSAGVVTNTIMSNLAFIQSIQDSYDYLVDVTVGGQSGAQTGSTYDAPSDTFNQYTTQAADIQGAMEGVIAALVQLINLSDLATTETVDSGMSGAESDYLSQVGDIATWSAILALAEEYSGG